MTEDPSGPELRPPRARSRATVLVALGFVPMVAIVIWMVAARPRPLPGTSNGRPMIAVRTEQPDPYAGVRVCAECHPGEAASHGGSGHASTLRTPDRSPLARRLDGTTVADPELPGVSWSYHFRDGRLEIARKGMEELDRWMADYVFGSGREATTFVSVLNPAIPAVLEHRLTYFTRDGLLGLTPGHETFPRPPGLTPHGGKLPPKIAVECFRCHSTRISARDEHRLDFRTMIPNVSCERCHGPGRAHVEAARRGASGSELRLPLGPGQWTAESLVASCGACHRHPSPARAAQLRKDDPSLVRFQPVGISQSACFRKSAGAFSCVTCHDPHARVSTDRPSYNLACLNCHGGKNSPTADDRPLAKAPPCPVSPRERCVDCHMPRVDAGQNLLFADHWIRVRRPDR